jgi:hypothetical protein
VYSLVNISVKNVQPLSLSLSLSLKSRNNETIKERLRDRHKDKEKDRDKRLKATHARNLANSSDDSYKSLNISTKMTSLHVLEHVRILRFNLGWQCLIFTVSIKIGIGWSRLPLLLGKIHNSLVNSKFPNSIDVCIYVLTR